MRPATIRTSTGKRGVRVDADSAVETGASDVRALPERPDRAGHVAAAAGRGHLSSIVTLNPGNVLVTSVAGVGECRSACRLEGER
jgi:hypothetical protein